MLADCKKCFVWKLVNKPSLPQKENRGQGESLWKLRSSRAETANIQKDARNENIKNVTKNNKSYGESFLGKVNFQQSWNCNYAKTDKDSHELRKLQIWKMVEKNDKRTTITPFIY